MTQADNKQAKKKPKKNKTPLLQFKVDNVCRLAKHSIHTAGTVIGKTKKKTKKN